MKRESLNILIRLINAKSLHVKHPYASQWLLESVVDVLKNLQTHLKDDAMLQAGADMVANAVHEWYTKQNLIQQLFKPNAQHKRDAYELVMVACGLGAWWKLGALIAELESKV